MQKQSLTRFYHPVMPVKKLKNRPLAVQIGSEKIALWKDGDGKISAVEDRCPHRFTPLSAGKVSKEGNIACPYHGWTADSKGAVATPEHGITKNCKIKSYSVIEKHNYIWIGQDENAIFPHFECDGWVSLASYPMEFSVPLHVVFDNFSEDEHFPYVHQMFGWNEDGAKDVQFDCKVLESELRVHYRGPQRKYFGMKLFMTKPGDYFDNKWVTRFDPIRTTYDVHATNKEGKPVNPMKNRAIIFFVPVGPDKTILHVFQFAKHENPKLNFMLRVTGPLAAYLTKKDLELDMKMTEIAANVPYELKGMRLGQYDKPIIAGRKLMEKIYYGESQRPTESSASLDL